MSVDDVIWRLRQFVLKAKWERGVVFAVKLWAAFVHMALREASEGSPGWRHLSGQERLVKSGRIEQVIVRNVPEFITQHNLPDSPADAPWLHDFHLLGTATPIPILAAAEISAPASAGADSESNLDLPVDLNELATQAIPALSLAPLASPVSLSEQVGSGSGSGVGVGGDDAVGGVEMGGQESQQQTQQQQQQLPAGNQTPTPTPPSNHPLSMDALPLPSNGICNVCFQSHTHDDFAFAKFTEGGDFQPRPFHFEDYAGRVYILKEWDVDYLIKKMITAGNVMITKFLMQDEDGAGLTRYLNAARRADQTTQLYACGTQWGLANFWTAFHEVWAKAYKPNGAPAPESVIYQIGTAISSLKRLEDDRPIRNSSNAARNPHGYIDAEDLWSAMLFLRMIHRHLRDSVRVRMWGKELNRLSNTLRRYEQASINEADRQRDAIIDNARRKRERDAIEVDVNEEEQPTRGLFNWGILGL
ncbi:hypothetical protein SAICODRAFT_202324 [Saitoella complicata NRRL Y-17804]|nr:uncharacterized protein SAICODRAFT_202324 [Saitoella complicata NRRL Y-17804]ODQ54652.1 hypothetical protein SAICODRAFT_202324 [Saitoella complicata NRRL Y-17804]